MSDNFQIKSIIAQEILDSRSNPTIRVSVTLSDNSIGTANVPSGASTGAHEAIELRDNDPNRFSGKGVLKAVTNVNNTIANKLSGMKFTDIETIDKTLIELDGTENKANLGANSILGVSLATIHAISNSNGIPLYQYISNITNNKMSLPVPMFNILNGGSHASNSTDIQEFMIIPSGLNSFTESLQFGAETYQSLKSLLSKEGKSTNVGDEGGFAPEMKSNQAAIEIILKAIENAGYKIGVDCYLGLDVAASEFYIDSKYELKKDNLNLDSDEMVEYLINLVNSYPILSIEDGLAEDDWNGWANLTQQIGNKIQLVGDDLYTTNVARLTKGIEKTSSNSILIKFNQIGSITETFDAIELAKNAKWSNVISHRSGETEDTTIADLAVGTGAGQIKTGAPARSERVAKYNRLLSIEEELKGSVSYAGKSAFPFLS
ncbi:MAG: phosphopyruvate hydratase [SAR202 cluster bacterium]|nr:phosphopyruvate hydratase [Chloroflexota bacterium]MQG51219.1 phosphopyruvate hydratase [SAR202 cluster bacterium]|tara:strand:+ start:6 stop:1304 length:1299 start_codon:yes stop_codon:yes gene_type:complete